MRFSLDVLRAKKGDCLMLHYGSETEPHLMVIDGGPSGVYKPQLKPRMERIRASRGLEDAEPLPIDVVMVSHIDDDHIRGIIELTKGQLKKNPGLRLRVDSLWHNAFEDLVTATPEELLRDFGKASFEASASRIPVFDQIQVSDEAERQAIDVLASISQGRQLRDDREALQKTSQAQRQWRLNHKFRGKLILAQAAAEPVKLDGELKVTVAGPMQPELLELKQAQDEWLREHGAAKTKTAAAMLAAFVDKSVPNLSSIVVFVELGGKSMLLTGDARGDKILNGLELARVLKPDGKRHVNILKVPHHGSENNMEPVFFRRLPADHYVFSGDGEHGNPARATFEMLLEARGADAEYEIHLTYPVAAIDKARRDHWMKERTKATKRQKKNSSTGKQQKGSTRAAWSPQKQSLAAFFKKNPKMARKCRFVSDKGPHLIDLFDPVSLDVR
jgi:hypothetical protein